MVYHLRVMRTKNSLYQRNTKKTLLGVTFNRITSFHKVLEKLNKKNQT